MNTAKSITFYQLRCRTVTILKYIWILRHLLSVVVLSAPVMMETPNHTAVEAQVWNFIFHCTVEGATEAPNLTLSGSHHSDKVFINNTEDPHTCLYSGLLYTSKCSDLRFDDRKATIKCHVEK